MEKVRVINKEGNVKFLHPRVAAKADVLKRKGYWIEEIEAAPAAKKTEAPKETKKAEEAETPAVEEPTPAPELNEPTLEELRVEYKEVLGRRPHHSWKEETLTQKIKDKKEENK